MGLKSNYVYFVYSEIQIKEENSIANRSGRKFECGLISIGNISKKFSKIVKEDDFQAMLNQYPDTKVVAKGNKFDFKFTNPKKVPIGE